VRWNLSLNPERPTSRRGKGIRKAGKNPLKLSWKYSDPRKAPSDPNSEEERGDRPVGIKGNESGAKQKA